MISDSYVSRTPIGGNDSTPGGSKKQGYLEGNDDGDKER